MATGGRVIEDEELFPTIHTHVRKTLGVDMEASAVGAVAEIEGVDRCLVAKGVQDHADLDKDDRFRTYAIETSYRFLTTFLRRYLPPPGRRAPFIVPQQPSASFTGRDDELQALGRVLVAERRDRVCTIAGLSGAGGIGKSALAVRFAELHRDRFPDGVIGIRVDGKEVDTIAREFVRNVGEAVEPDDERDAAAIMQATFGPLVDALRRVGAEDEAEEVLKPALALTPHDEALQRLSKPEGGRDIVESDAAVAVTGRIKRLLKPMGRPRYGFLTRDDDGSDVYFNERRIGAEVFSKLALQTPVEAKVVRTERGPQAWEMRILAD